MVAILSLLTLNRGCIVRTAPAAPRPGAALSPPTSSMEQSWGAAWGHHRRCNWRTPTVPMHIPSPVVWQILAVALLMYLLCGSNVPGCSDCTWRSVFAKPWCCRGVFPHRNLNSPHCSCGLVVANLIWWCISFRQSCSTNELCSSLVSGQNRL